MAIRSIGVTVARVLQIMVGIIITGLYAYIAHVIVESRPEADALFNELEVEMTNHGLGDKYVVAGEKFTNNLLQTPKRIWFAIGVGLWLVLFEVASIITNCAGRGRKYLTVLIAFQAVTFVLLIALIASNGSLAVEIEPFCLVGDEVWPAVKIALRQVAPGIGDLFFFCPISKAETAVAGLAVILSLSIFGAMCTQRFSKRYREEQRLLAVSEPTTPYTPVPEKQMSYQVNQHPV